MRNKRTEPNVKKGGVSNAADVADDKAQPEGTAYTGGLGGLFGSIFIANP